MEGAARPEERREDTDGKRYLRSEFEAHYGRQAPARWAAALPPGAEWVFVFHCNGRTERECLDRRLLGGPAHGGKKMSGGQSISSGTALLLFNFGDRTVYSSLRAAGAPAKGIVPEAWGGKFVSAAAPFASSSGSSKKRLHSRGRSSSRAAPCGASAARSRPSLPR